MGLSLAADAIFGEVFCAQDLSGINLLRIASSIFLLRVWAGNLEG